MNRLELKQLAEERLLAAEALIASRNWPSAYYIAGYAVELGLKACVLARLATSPELVFDSPKNKFAESCWTHRINDLMKLAGLEQQLAADMNANAALQANWQTVASWTEISRYELRSENDARALYNAINSQNDGVMQWLRQRW